MRIDWPIVFAFSAVLCMAALSEPVALRGAIRNAFGVGLMASFAALAVTLFERRK